MRASITKSLLIITGAMGAGKTSVLGEASDILTLHYIAHAAIDVDALGLRIREAGKSLIN
jgi:predicted ABC-type ATPase